MARLCAAARRARRTRRRLIARRKPLADQFRSIHPKQLLLRQAARIEALAENEPWIASLETEIQQASESVAQFTTQRQAHQNHLSTLLGDQSSSVSSNPNALPIHLDRRIYRSLRRPARCLSQGPSSRPG